MIDPAVVASDEALLRANANDFGKMALQRLHLNLSSRLNKERVDARSGDNPEKGRMYGLADGMEIPLPAGFQPNGKVDYRTGEPARDYSSAHAEPLRELHLQGAAWPNGRGREQDGERPRAGLGRLRGRPRPGAAGSVCMVSLG